MTELAAMPTARWTILRPHEIQRAYFNSQHRFNVVPAGRRSGKTEIAKRRLISRAMTPSGWPGGSVYPKPRYFAAAPTRDQAKRLYWEDLKALLPKELVLQVIESELTIRTILGSEIVVLGMDKPERIEGAPWDGGILDEYGNMKAQAWGANVRPALADRRGWCDLIGVPEGRNHYYDISEAAQAQYTEFGAASEWAYFHWKSKDILPADEIAAAMRDLDELTFKQEFEGSFVNFSGRAYYGYDSVLSCQPLRKLYNDAQPLIICLDFNVSPGVAAVCQEHHVEGQAERATTTCAIGEVHIPRGSNTPVVCRRLVDDWGDHKGMVYVYGDATGGNSGSAKVAGSDWDIVEAILRPVFGTRLLMRVPRSNPPERVRVNAMNSRLCNMAGERRLLVDRMYAPNLARDLDSVGVLTGSAGELDKSDPGLTHLSDALGYYVSKEFPIVRTGVVLSEQRI